MITNFGDFITELLGAGFSVAGGNDEGVFGLIGFSWENQPPGGPVRWHTGDPETDPWEWRIRVLEERNDIAYAKVFFRKAGYITREWYPYFLAARRGGREYADFYADGLMSRDTKRVMDVLAENRALPVHELKLLVGFGKEKKSRFDKALADLQMDLFITMCGRAQKRNKYGEEYGWNSTVFCISEEFWERAVFDQAAEIGAQKSFDAISERIYQLNPNADGRKVRKFILGRRQI
ncbi:MAG: hypothetical protein LBJ99_02120 [Oscillospiraceae bacterium]|jgi:hypothetical protein|nr:hypothetical protein [Oscillospiraceae bacterium]